MLLRGEFIQTPAPVPSIPVLCYHNIYQEEGKKDNAYFISKDKFHAQMKALADSGYHTILPDQLIACLTKGALLPAKPVLLTFDDTRLTHFTIAAGIIEQFGFRGTFFIMTIAIGKPGYMNAAQLKLLADRGHVIGAHTWDHPYLSQNGKKDWQKQIWQPKAALEKITSKQVGYFAYPFGQWNEELISELEAAGYKAAFQLNGKVSAKKPLYTIRRIMADGNWSGTRLQAVLKTAFAADTNKR